MQRRVLLAMSLVLAGPVSGQAPCLPLNRSVWYLVATRFFQSSGTAPRISGVAVERHFIDRRMLRRDGSGYLMQIDRTKLGLRDETVSIGVEYASNGAVTRITGDTGSIAHDVSQLFIMKCGGLTTGVTMPDLGGRTDTLRLDTQRSITRTVPSRAIRVDAQLDTLGATLKVVSAQRMVTDTARGDMLRRLPNQPVDTVHPWTQLSGEESERSLVRAADGLVMFRERARQLDGRGWVPPHDLTDTVPVRVQNASIERVVDSATAAGVLRFGRRGELLVSATQRDTVALHYREWRGDTLVLHQFRRSGWRDELRTVWRDSILVSASLMEPGTVTQRPGPYWRPLRVQGGYLFDSGAKDSISATPTHPWAIALDGFEDAVVPALLGVPADGQPHRFSMYGLSDTRGSWLNWSVTIASRGPVRVARFSTLQRQFVGVFVFTPTGELLLSNLGGAGGILRVPAAGTRLAGLLDAARSSLRREDLGPPGTTPAP